MFVGRLTFRSLEILKSKYILHFRVLLQGESGGLWKQRVFYFILLILASALIGCMSKCDSLNLSELQMSQLWNGSNIIYLSG